MMRRSRKSRGGLVLLDTMVGIGIIVILSIIAATTAGWQRRASRQMSDLRTATDLAESTLIDLHQGRTPPPVGEGESVMVEQISGGEAIAGFAWCKVTATVNHRSISLTGLSKREGAVK